MWTKTETSLRSGILDPSSIVLTLDELEDFSLLLSIIISRLVLATAFPF